MYQMDGGRKEEKQKVREERDDNKQEKSQKANGRELPCKEQSLAVVDDRDSTAGVAKERSGSGEDDAAADESAPVTVRGSRLTSHRWASVKFNLFSSLPQATR